MINTSTNNGRHKVYEFQIVNNEQHYAWQNMKDTRAKLIELFDIPARQAEQLIHTAINAYFLTPLTYYGNTAGICSIEQDYRLVCVSAFS